MKLKRNNSAANVIGKTHFEKSLAGVAIIVIIVLHFVSQFSFSQKENTSKIEAINQRSIEIRREAPKPPDVVRVPEAATQPVAPTVVVDQPEEPEAIEETTTTAAPTRTIIRKKEARESKTERLRRLEKFLTGV